MGIAILYLSLTTGKPYLINSMRNKPDENTLRTMFYDEIKGFRPIKAYFDMYELMDEDDTRKTYEWLIKSVDKHIEKTTREQHRTDISNHLNRKAGRGLAIPAQEGHRKRSFSGGRKRSPGGSCTRGRGSPS